MMVFSSSPFWTICVLLSMSSDTCRKWNELLLQFRAHTTLDQPLNIKTVPTPHYHEQRIINTYRPPLALKVTKPISSVETRMLFCTAMLSDDAVLRVISVVN